MLSPVQVGWIIACSFIIVVILIIVITCLAFEDKIGNPFAPFIRAYEKRQQHRYEMDFIRLRAELAKTQLDPRYVEILEKEVRK